MKKSKFIAALIVALALCCLSLFAACGGTPTPTPPGNTHTVTFNANYEGGANTTVTVEDGKAAEKPAAPTRTGFDFENWYKDAECTELFDFTVEITADTTVYANWLESGVTYYKLTLHKSETDTSVIKVKENSRAAKPADPKADGKYFAGWYTDEGCTSEFKFSTRINADTDLYAKWFGLYTFEAEDLILDDFSGPGYSGGTYGTSAIITDTKNAAASNGYYLSYLYARYDSPTWNTTLEFHITASEAVQGAALILRLSAEYADIELDGDMYEVLVNGGKLGYEGIKFEGAQAATSNEKVLPFEDFVISAAVNLRAGDNVITLRTANSIKQGTGGTMNSTAPLVDCVKIATEKTALTWTEGYKANGNY